MEDTHICITDLAKNFGCNVLGEEVISFYGVSSLTYFGCPLFVCWAVCEIISSCPNSVNWLTRSRRITDFKCRALKCFNASRCHVWDKKNNVADEWWCSGEEYGKAILHIKFQKCFSVCDIWKRQLVKMIGVWWTWGKGCSKFCPWPLTKGHCWGCWFPFRTWESGHKVIYGNRCCLCKVMLSWVCPVFWHNCSHCNDIWEVSSSSLLVAHLFWFLPEKRIRKG